MDQTALADRMEKLAETHPRAADLREKAAALREGVAGFFGAPQTVTVQSFLGRWARARRLWCDITGEPLV